VRELIVWNIKVSGIFYHCKAFGSGDDDNVKCSNNICYRSLSFFIYSYHFFIKPTTTDTMSRDTLYHKVIYMFTVIRVWFCTCTERAVRTGNHSYEKNRKGLTKQHVNTYESYTSTTICSPPPRAICSPNWITRGSATTIVHHLHAQGFASISIIISTVQHYTMYFYGSSAVCCSADRIATYRMRSV
jgi:hypothetical protein